MADRSAENNAIAQYIAYQLLESKKLTNTCTSPVDVIQIMSKVLYAADAHCGLAEPRQKKHKTNPSGLSITRTITSGKSEQILQGLIDDLDAIYIQGDNSLLTSIKLVREFRDKWVHSFESIPIVFNYPKGPRETAGMILDASTFDIPVHVGAAATEFSLHFEGGMFVTFYYPNLGSTLPLQNIKDIISDEKKAMQLLRENYQKSCGDLEKIASKIDAEITKVNPSHNWWDGIPFEIPGYKPENEAIILLYSEYITIKQALKQPHLPEMTFLGELTMPTFTMSCETDILNSEEFISSPLYEKFMGADSRVKEYIGTLINLYNKTTVTLNELGGYAYSETGADFMDKGCCDDGPEKKLIKVKIDRAFGFEINSYSCNGEIVTHFAGKVMEPIPAHVSASFP